MTPPLQSKFDNYIDLHIEPKKIMQSISYDDL